MSKVLKNDEDIVCRVSPLGLFEFTFGKEMSGEEVIVPFKPEVISTYEKPVLIEKSETQNADFDKIETATDTEELQEIKAKQAEIDKLISEARLAAEDIVASARKKAAIMEQEGYNKGLEQGTAQGFEFGVEQARKETERIRDAELQKFAVFIGEQTKIVTSEKEKTLECYVDDLKNISLSIGEKIVQTSLRSSSEVILKMILSATEKMKRVAWAKIYIGDSGNCLEVQGDAEFLKSLSRIAENVKIVVIDEELGTVIVETPEEILDVSVKTQLENIKEILYNVRN